jgi:PAS domain S-box-containing protein
MLRHFNSLRTRLNCLVLLAVFPGLGLTLYAYMKELQLHKAYVRDEAVLLAQVVSTHHQQVVTDTQQLLVVLAQLPQIQNSHNEICPTLLKKLQQQYPRYAALGVVQRSGSVSCSSIPSQNVNFADRAWLRNAIQKRQLSVSDYQIGRMTRKPVIVFGYPVMNANQVESVVFASLDLAWLNQFVAQINLPPSTSLIVIDFQGVVLAHYPKSEWVGKAPNLPIIHKILTEGNGVAEIVDVDRIPRLYAFRSLSNLPQINAYMGIGLSEKAPFAVAEQNLQRNLLGLVMISAGAIAILWIGSDVFILHWIRRFTHAINRFASGDFTARVSLEHIPREMRQLADTFNSMTRSLANQIVQRNQVQEDLKRANERFQLATAAVNAIIYDWDLSKKTITRTQGLFDVLGYSTTEADSTYDWWFERIHPDEQKYARNYIAQVLKNTTNADFSLEYRVCNRDQHYIYVWEKGLIVRNPDGIAVRVVGSILDITERKQAEAAVNQMNVTLEQQVQERTAQLAATNQELESFCYSVSHDLRTPLRHLTGFAEALAQQLERNNVSDVKINRYIEAIQSSSERMTILIDGLLTLSRVGRKQLANQPVELYSLVETAISLVINQDGVDHAIEFKIGHFPKVMGDPTLLQQIFTNLIDNAVKFTRYAQPAIIQIDSLPDYTLFVKDNGVGFQMEYADQLFAAFQRLHSQKEFKGTGIGLAIVQRIIHRHGGTIWVDSKPNQGTTFYFKLGQVVEE